MPEAQEGRLIRWLLGLGVRAAMTLVHRIRLALWRLRKPTADEVRAIVLTPDGKVVLVTHSYTPGWYLPGGGAKRGETAEAAMLRELREEIGLLRFSKIARADPVDAKRDGQKQRWLFVVTGAEYAPRWNLEIAVVGAFDPHALPAGCTASTGRRIAALLDRR